MITSIFKAVSFNYQDTTERDAGGSAIFIASWSQCCWMGCQGNDATGRRKSMPVRLIFTSSTLHLLVHLKLMMLMRWYEMLWQSEAAGMGIGARREGGRAHLIDEYSLFYIDDTVWSSWSSSCKQLLLWLLVLHLQTVANQQLRRWNFTLRHTFLPNERRRRRPEARCHLWRGWEGEEQWASKCTVALINLHSFAEINYMHKYTLFLIDYSRPMTETACRYHSVGDGCQPMCRYVVAGCALCCMQIYPLTPLDVFFFFCCCWRLLLFC